MFFVQWSPILSASHLYDQLAPEIGEGKDLSRSWVFKVCLCACVVGYGNFSLFSLAAMATFCQQCWLTPSCLNMFAYFCLKVYLSRNAIICFQILSQYFRLRKESSKSWESSKILNRHPVLFRVRWKIRQNIKSLYL